MRALGMIGILLALVIVAVLAKKQLGAVTASPALAPAVAPVNSTPPGDVRAQSQQIQQQIKQSLEAAQQRRSVPDDN